MIHMLPSVSQAKGCVLFQNQFVYHRYWIQGVSIPMISNTFIQFWISITSLFQLDHSRIIPSLDSTVLCYLEDFYLHYNDFKRFQQIWVSFDMTNIWHTIPDCCFVNGTLCRLQNGVSSNLDIRWTVLLGTLAKCVFFQIQVFPT